MDFASLEDNQSLIRKLDKTRRKSHKRTFNEENTHTFKTTENCDKKIQPRFLELVSRTQNIHDL
jgi:macrodomain Ter protein organizer (MatP/YcbG family)